MEALRFKFTYFGFQKNSYDEIGKQRTNDSDLNVGQWMTKLVNSSTNTSNFGRRLGVVVNRSHVTPLKHFCIFCFIICLDNKKFKKYILD